jgi:hypothetical protein
VRLGAGIMQELCGLCWLVQAGRQQGNASSCCLDLTVIEVAEGIHDQDR